MNAKQLKDLDECAAMDAEGVSKDCSICSCRVCLSQEAKLLYEASVGRAALKGFKDKKFYMKETGKLKTGVVFENEKELLEWAEKESEAESEPIF